MKKSSAINLVITLGLLLGTSMLAGCGSDGNGDGDNGTSISGEKVTIKSDGGNSGIATATVVVPEGWAHKIHYREDGVSLYHHEPPAKDSYGGNIPCIGISITTAPNIGVTSTADSFLRDLDSKKIGDVECAGLAYKHIAGDSFQYVGTISGSLSIYVYANGFDADDPEVKAIIDSITISVDN